MSWSDIKIENSGKYLKIEGGSYADIHILDEHPTKELIHGFGKDKITCPGEGCHICDNPETPLDMQKKERWKTNVLDRKDGKVKILEFGPQIAGQIREISKMLSESLETVHHVDFRISATAGENKKYTVMQKKMMLPVPQNLTLHKL